MFYPSPQDAPNLSGKCSNIITKYYSKIGIVISLDEDDTMA